VTRPPTNPASRATNQPACQSNDQLTSQPTNQSKSQQANQPRKQATAETQTQHSLKLMTVLADDKPKFRTDQQKRYNRDSLLVAQQSNARPASQSTLQMADARKLSTNRPTASSLTRSPLSVVSDPSQALQSLRQASRSRPKHCWLND